MPGRSGAQFQVERNEHESQYEAAHCLRNDRFALLNAGLYDKQLMRIAQVKGLRFMPQTDR
jgi:hypothetical protein